MDIEDRTIKDNMKFIGTGQTSQGEEVKIEFETSIVEIRKEYSNIFPNSPPTLYISPKYNEETRKFMNMSVGTPKKKKLSFKEYTDGELYENTFKQVLSQILIENRVSCEGVEALRGKIEFPFNSEMLLEFYLLKEELDNNLSEYVELFGVELVSTGAVLMSNLKQIHEKVNGRISRSYMEYGEKFARNIK